MEIGDYRFEILNLQSEIPDLKSEIRNLQSEIPNWLLAGKTGKVESPDGRDGDIL
jgi:hypothetical protein